MPRNNAEAALHAASMKSDAATMQRQQVAMELLTRAILGASEELHQFRTEKAADTRMSERAGTLAEQGSRVAKLDPQVNLNSAATGMLTAVSRLLSDGLRTGVAAFTGAVLDAGR